MTDQIEISDNISRSFDEHMRELQSLNRRIEIMTRESQLEFQTIKKMNKKITNLIGYLFAVQIGLIVGIIIAIFIGS